MYSLFSRSIKFHNASTVLHIVRGTVALRATGTESRKNAILFRLASSFFPRASLMADWKTRCIRDTRIERVGSLFKINNRANTENGYKDHGVPWNREKLPRQTDPTGTEIISRPFSLPRIRSRFHRCGWHASPRHTSREYFQPATSSPPELRFAPSIRLSFDFTVSNVLFVRLSWRYSRKSRA